MRRTMGDNNETDKPTSDPGDPAKINLLRLAITNAAKVRGYSPEILLQAATACIAFTMAANNMGCVIGGEYENETDRITVTVCVTCNPKGKAPAPAGKPS